MITDISRIFCLLALAAATLLGGIAPPTTPADAQELTRVYDYGSAVPNPYHSITGSVDLVHEAHFGWVRLSAFWDQIEAQNNQWDFAILDSLVDEAVDNELGILLQIHPFFPAWVSGQSEPRDCWGAYECSYLPSDLNAFKTHYRDFVRKLAQRYGNRVKYFKVWSEPDGQWFFRGSASQYVNLLLKPARSEILQYVPDAKILGPGVWSKNNFLDAVLNAACNDIDIITFHTYAGSTVNDRMNKVNQLRNTAVQRCPGKPIWLTEFGFKESDVGASNQGPMINDVMSQSLAVPGIEKVFQYRMREAVGQGGHGLVEQNHLTGQVVRKKPAFYDVQNFLDWRRLAACVPDADTACLRDGRFKVEGTWRTANGQTGTAKFANFGSEEAAVMWFFAPSNLEVLLKVLDGCGLNDRFWFFSAATTDVEYHITVTDTFTGDSKTYDNALGTSAPAVTDTNALATCDAGPHPVVSGTFGTPINRPGSAGCTPSPTVMCLRNGRFKVEVDWTTSTSSGDGRKVPYGTADSGLFWFFAANNWEMLVKVLNGCSVNNRFWVFAAAATNQGYTLKVTDTVTGQVKTYTNPLGNLAPAITDTSAFATCGS